MDVPNEAIAAMARSTSRAKRKATVSLPIAYVKRADPTPTAAMLLQSHELRLKLHITLVMQATSAPHTIPDRPTRSLARLMALLPETGPRRAGEAMKFLKAKQLIKPQRLSDGRPGLLVLHPDGSGAPIEGYGSRYVGVPIALWEKKWILRLSGRAVAVLLALLELTGGRTSHPDGELMDGYRKRQYGLSDDTWTRATKELERFGILRTTNVTWGDDDYEIRRRKRYLVSKEALEADPTWAD